MDKRADLSATTKLDLLPTIKGFNFVNKWCVNDS